MKTVLVTGANGFVGVPVCRALVCAGWRVLGGVRRQTAVVELPKEVQGVFLPDIRETEDWKPSLRGVDTLVHLVARTHVMRDGTRDLLVEYRRINVEGLRRLADACIATGVRRLVFMSSIKVVGG